MAKKVVYLPAGAEDSYDDLEDDEDFVEHFQKQLKISSTENILKGVGLGNRDFDATLTPAAEKKLEEILQSFVTYYNEAALISGIDGMLNASAEPHKLALKLYHKCTAVKQPLGTFILNGINRLSKMKKDLHNHCDDNTRMVAFNIFKNIKPGRIEVVASAYSLQKIVHHILPNLKEILRGGQYKMVAKWAIVLHITEEFGILDIVFPLILTKKFSNVMEYLNVTPSLQVPTAQFLDSLLDLYKAPYENCYNFLEVYQYKNIYLSLIKTNRQLIKILNTICKTYKIPDSLVPNHLLFRALSYCRHIFNEYLAGNICTNAFVELVLDVLVTKQLQIAFIEYLTKGHHINEAIFFANAFKLSPSNLPPILIMQRHLWPGMLKVDLCPNDKYLQLDMELYNIIFVQDNKNFESMINHLRHQDIIGFDTEWKPIWNKRSENVSLLQFATKDRIFLVDCLEKTLTSDLWKALEKYAFNNSNILKLGFAISCDIKMLNTSLPITLKKNMSGYLDLQDLYNYLKNLNVKFPYDNGDNSGSGLSRLTYLCLGKPLDKRNCISNWARRPLRKSQVIYAAMDVHCLLKIYDVIDEMLSAQHLDLKDIIEDIHSGCRKLNKNKYAQTKSTSADS